MLLTLIPLLGLGNPWRSWSIMGRCEIEGGSGLAATRRGGSLNVYLFLSVLSPVMVKQVLLVLFGC